MPNLDASIEQSGPGIVATPIWWLDASAPLSYSGSGTVWTDLMGNFDFDMEGSPGPTFNGAAGDRAAFFDFDRANSFRASQDYLGTWLMGLGNTTTPLTIEALIYVPSNGYQILLGTSGFGGQAGYGHHFMQFDDKSLVDGWLFDPIMPTGTWVHLTWAGFFDGVTEANIAVNGVVTGAPKIALGQSYVNAHTRMRLGHTGTKTYGDAYGMNPGSRVALFRGYDRVLTAEEIAQNFEADRDRFGL